MHVGPCPTPGAEEVCGASSSLRGADQYACFSDIPFLALVTAPNFLWNVIPLPSLVFVIGSGVVALANQTVAYPRP